MVCRGRREEHGDVQNTSDRLLCRSLVWPGVDLQFDKRFGGEQERLSVRGESRKTVLIENV